MSRDGAERLALIVRQGPYQGRSARDQLDIALAAAASGAGSLEHAAERGQIENRAGRCFGCAFVRGSQAAGVLNAAPVKAVGECPERRVEV